MTNRRSFLKALPFAVGLAWAFGRADSNANIIQNRGFEMANGWSVRPWAAADNQIIGIAKSNVSAGDLVEICTFGTAGTT